MGFPGGSDGEESTWNAGDLGSIPVWEDPLEREWLSTPVFWFGEFHGQRSLTGYSPWSCKESDTTGHKFTVFTRNRKGPPITTL